MDQPDDPFTHVASTAATRPVPERVRVQSSRLYVRGLLASVVAVPASATLAAWSSGDLSTGLPDERTFVLDPVLSERGLAAVGSLGLILLVAAVLAVRSVRELWRVFACLTGVGLALGRAYRIFTAGSGGANIGAGLLALFGGPAALVVVVVAVTEAVRRRPLRRSRGDDERRQAEV